MEYVVETRDLTKVFGKFTAVDKLLQPLSSHSLTSM